MNRGFGHPLYIEPLPDYAPRLEALIATLGGYRPGDGIDWRQRIELWLSNFAGLRDQRIALEMLERLRIVSDREVVAGCSALLEKIRGELPRGTRMLHLAHETSGAVLMRVLEKELKVRKFAVLRPDDFAKLGELKKLRDGDTAVVWDRFNGTGRQLRSVVRRYTGHFEKAEKRVASLRLAYISGHPPKKSLPAGVVLHRWIEDIPMVSPEEADLCARYAEAAGKTETNQKHETGALISFADNPPNNVPLVLRARPSETWFTLLDRKETAMP
ncbi:MAG TPA: hypothetical protein VLS89_10605 [Candidatus Nanopelagicales bacterium]|nr:hypothetical protein [Candidatus Nanopelagicales bacterium]